MVSRLLFVELQAICCEERTLWAPLQSHNKFHGSHVDDLAKTWYVLDFVQSVNSLTSFALSTLQAHLRVGILQALCNALTQLLSRHLDWLVLLSLHNKNN